MSKRVTIDRLTLRLPRHAAADPKAIAKEVGRVLGEQANVSQDRLAVVTHAPRAGEGSRMLARRIGVAVGRNVKGGG